MCRTYTYPHNTPDFHPLKVSIPPFPNLPYTNHSLFINEPQNPPSNPIHPTHTLKPENPRLKHFTNQQPHPTQIISTPTLHTQTQLLKPQNTRLPSIRI